MKKVFIFILLAILSYNAKSEEKPAIILIKNSKGDLTFKISLKTQGEIRVDWGNNNIKSYSVNATTRVEEATVITERVNKNVAVKIYGNISLFSCIDQFIYSLNVSNAKELVTLNCSKNYLTKIDLSKNAALKSFNCHDNRIKSIDFSNNKKITSLTATYNFLRNINIEKNTALLHLNIGDNNIRDINLNQNKSLKHINLSGNKVSVIHVEHISTLRHLDISYNKFSSCTLNSVFNEIPSIPGEEKLEKKNLIINFNKGTTNSKTALAVDKNWNVDVTGKDKAKCGI